MKCYNQKADVHIVLFIGDCFLRHLRNKQFVRQFKMPLTLISKGKQSNERAQFDKDIALVIPCFFKFL